MTGLRRKTWPVSRLGSGLIAIMIMGNTCAADSRQVQPSLELLEFLLEFDTGDGQWHDPAEIDPEAWRAHEQVPVLEPEPESETLQESGA